MAEKVYDMGTPRALEGYDVFAALMLWKRDGTEQERRRWSISLWEGKDFRCRLTWNRDGQMCALEMAATNPQEAVWKAREHFKVYEAGH